jgi:hypothetical protein
MNITKRQNTQRINASERHWGIWYLSSDKPLSLNIYPYNNPEPYEIEVDRLGTPGHVLSWINHFIESKPWFDRINGVDAIRDFMVACKQLQKEGIAKPVNDGEQNNWGY